MPSVGGASNRSMWPAVWVAVVSVTGAQVQGAAACSGNCCALDSTAAQPLPASSVPILHHRADTQLLPPAHKERDFQLHQQQICCVEGQQVLPSMGGFSLWETFCGVAVGCLSV
jgi:hypothetical protein